MSQKPLASKIDTVDSVELIAQQTNGIFSAAILEAELERLKIARANKAEFKAANAHVFEQEKAINEAEKNARRKVYALLGAAAQSMTDEDFAAFRNDLLEGLGYQPKYEVHGDEIAIRDWCIQNAPYLLEVNRAVFDAQVRAMDDMASFVKRPTAMPPAIVVECILPTISDKLPLSGSESPAPAPKKEKAPKSKPAETELASLPADLNEIDF